jgi:orotate phosphoribosyltransferase
MDDPRARLHALIRTHALKVSREQPFLLASGRTSSFLFDIKPVVLRPDGAALIGDLLLAKLSGLAPAVAVAGLELGAIPIVSSVVARSAQAGRPIPGLMVRKQAKERGTRSRIEGDTAPPGRVVVLEDVSTTGGSALSAVEALRERGFTVDAVVSIVDREEGAAANLKAHGLDLHSLFTKSDFGVDVA